MHYIENLSKQYNTPVENFYNAFIFKLNEIEKFIEGKKANKVVPTVGAEEVKVHYIPEQGKDPAQKYKITGIDVSYIEKLRKHKNSRY
jgi:hypothetical protein